MLFNEKLACPDCGVSYPEISPRTFSFNSPYGACPACLGLGTKAEFDPLLIIPDSELSINEGAIAPWGTADSFWVKHLAASLAQHYGFSLDTPFKKLPAEYSQHAAVTAPAMRKSSWFLKGKKPV